MKVAALVICLFAAACMRPAESLNTGAVDAAVAFTTRALVDKDFAAAHVMLSDEERKQTPLPEFEQALRSQHKSGYPLKVKALDSRNGPDFDGIVVYLVGDHGTGSWYYMVGMKREPSGHFAPVGLTRSDVPFRRSQLIRSVRPTMEGE
jgi:hypothetical protein